MISVGEDNHYFSQANVHYSYTVEFDAGEGLADIEKVCLMGNYLYRPDQVMRLKDGIQQKVTAR